MTTLQFRIEGFPDGLLAPFEVIATEAISTLYAAEIACELIGDKRPDPSVIGRRAVLDLAPPGCTPQGFPGVIESFGMEASQVAGRRAVCRFRLVPLMALLRLTRQNHLFGTSEPIELAEVIKTEMEGTLRRGSKVLEKPRPIEYETRLSQRYAPLLHLAQYEETNFDFLSRLTERYGIFYFFDLYNGNERVVFGDSNLAAPAIEGDPVVRWHPWTSGVSPVVPETVHVLRSQHDWVTGKVYMRDYNESTPHVDLAVHKNVGAGGSGAWTEMEERFMTREEGELFARIRAEELESRQHRLYGSSTSLRLAAGHMFELRDHPFDEWNQRYLVLSVTHTMRAPRPGVPADPDLPMGYRNDFVVQPLSIPFRPERRTPRPRLYGLMSGWIEGDPNVKGPQMDNQGRYKVRLPYDLSDSPDGKGSRWVRMATPFAGEGDGMHFPLHPGTEVVVSHVNGNPDWPVIVGAVPNAATPSVVTGADPKQNLIRFRSGMGLSAASADPSSNTGNSSRIWTEHAPAHGGEPQLPAPYQWLRLGRAEPFVDRTVPVDEGANAADGFDLATGGTGRLFAPQDLFLIRNGAATASPPREPSVINAPTNRLLAITDSQMLLAHDGRIVIGEAEGSPGYPDEVVINARKKLVVKTQDNTNISSGVTWNLHSGLQLTMCAGARVAVRASSFGIVPTFNVSFIGGADIKMVVGPSIGLLGTFDLKYATYKAEIFSLGEFKATLKETKIAGGSVELNGPGGFFSVKPKKVDVDTLETKLSTLKTEIQGTTTSAANTQVNLRNIFTELQNTRTALSNANINVGTSVFM